MQTKQMRRISSSMEQLEAATLALHDSSVPPQLLAQVREAAELLCAPAQLRVADGLLCTLLSFLRDGAAGMHARPHSLPPSQMLQLHDRALQLQLAIQRMANIKEYRTPQVGRHSRAM